MRKMTMTAAGLALALTTVAYAQNPAVQAPAAAPETTQAPPATPVIRSVSIIDVEDLSAEARTQVDAMASETTETDLQNLRSSLQRNPQVASALEAEGLTADMVVAAAMDPAGKLTLITRKS